MLKRFVGMALICSTLLGGCATTTTTQTCVGPICSEPQTTTTQSWPDSPHHSHEGGGDPTGAIIALSAIVTAVALTAVIKHRGDNDAESNHPKQAAMTDEDMRLERMYAQAHLSVRAGRCEAVVAIGKKLERESPDEYERFASDRELAPCLLKPEAVSIR
jgi:hypothetical protein